jgi:hypothetical protein
MTAFDLFRTTSEGTEWLGTFLTIDLAKSDAESFSAQVPGEYFVVDQCSGIEVFELRATRIRSFRSGNYENRVHVC